MTAILAPSSHSRWRASPNLPPARTSAGDAMADAIANDHHQGKTRTGGFVIATPRVVCAERSAPLCDFAACRML
jgi:hypothetical protein